MLNKYILYLQIVINLTSIYVRAQVGNMVCFYNEASFLREGAAQLSIHELEPALNFCNYLIYGYAAIDAETYKLTALNRQLVDSQNHYRTIITLKRKYPQLRVLLSLGGDHDIELDINKCEDSKYLKLLETSERRAAFKQSVYATLSNYGFDGIDLAWQFPKSKPKTLDGSLKKAWRTFKNWFTNGDIIDKYAMEHRQQFVQLLHELRNELQPNGYLITLTVLPNVDAELFIDISSVVPLLNFITLCAFDFQTPLRDPKMADLPAPLYEMYDRNVKHNANYQINYWLNQTAVPAYKIYLGVTGYGRAWIMSRDSGITGYPPIVETAGAAPPGKQTQTDGLLSWPEICELLQANKELMDGETAALRKVGDPTKRYGIYAYRAADDNGQHGLWVGYEDPQTVAIKADYARAKNLGGIALFDLSMDDFRGQCAGEKYPILRSIKYKL